MVWLITTKSPLYFRTDGVLITSHQHWGSDVYIIATKSYIGGGKQSYHEFDEKVDD